MLENQNSMRDQDMFELEKQLMDAERRRDRWVWGAAPLCSMAGVSRGCCAGHCWRPQRRLVPILQLFFYLCIIE